MQGFVVSNVLECGMKENFLDDNFSGRRWDPVCVDEVTLLVRLCL